MNRLSPAAKVLIGALTGALAFLAALVTLLVFVTGCQTLDECLRRVRPGTPSPPRVTLGLITVPSDSNRGVVFVAPERGTYEFTYVSGAYSIYPEGAGPPGIDTWLTSVAVFRGDPLWIGDDLDQDSAAIRLFANQYWPTESDAEREATGLSSSISLEAGEAITLVAVDDRLHYDGNVGEVRADVSRVR